MKTIAPRLFVALAGSLVATAALAMPVHAAEMETPVSFSYVLDQAARSDAGAARAAYWDIKRDARKACRHPGLPAHDLTAVDQSCVARIVDAVIAQAGVPLLTARHEGSSLQRLARRSDDSQPILVVLR